MLSVWLSHDVSAYGHLGCFHSWFFCKLFLEAVNNIKDTLKKKIWNSEEGITLTQKLTNLNEPELKLNVSLVHPTIINLRFH